MEVLLGHAFLPLSLNLSACVTRVGSLHLYFTTLSHKGEGSSCLRRFYNVWQKPMWQVKIVVRRLRKDNSACEWGQCGNICNLRMKRWECGGICQRVRCFFSAWVLFLYSTRNKTLRGFFIRARWCAFRAFFPLSSSQLLCTKSLRTTRQMNKNYNLKAWEHLVGICF